MSSERQIILHAGLPKTGTSTIQHALHANREFLLLEERILYPSIAANLSTPLRTIFRDFQDGSWKPIASKMANLSTEEEMERGKKYRDSLEAEISSCEWDTLLLSAEGVFNMSESEIKKLREWGERYSSNWTVLVCVRHPLDWTRSVLQQRLKQGDTLRQLYEKPPIPAYRDRISKAISVFGWENVRVFDFDTAVENSGGIVSAFAEQAELSAASGDFLASGAIRKNDSLSLEAVQILDSLNRQRPLFVDNVRDTHRPGPKYEIHYLRRIKGRKFDVPEPVKEIIRSQSREDVGWLNETFGLDLYRDIADSVEPLQSPEEPLGALGDPATDSIAEIFGELVTADVFRRALERGRKALSQGNLERAEKIFQEAARLDPDAQQPKKLLEEVTAKQQANTEEPASQEKPGTPASRASFLSRFRR